MIANNLINKEIAAIEYFKWQPIELAPGLNVLQWKGEHNHYIRIKHKKVRIVLHYTAGVLAGDIPELTQSAKKSVPFLIARSGQILQLFDEKFWAWHLGSGSLGGNEEMSSTSIGIEISNVGWLRKAGQGLFTWAGKEYCHQSMTELYVDKHYRGEDTWATFTDAQYISLRLLLKYLTDKYEIPFERLGPEDRLERTRKVLDPGIFTHANFRFDKWDIGPAFDWDKVWEENPTITAAEAPSLTDGSVEESILNPDVSTEIIQEPKGLITNIPNESDRTGCAGIFGRIFQNLKF